MLDQAERKRVLVVDDDRDFVRTMELYLRYEGYDVSYAYGGLGAIEEMTVTNPDVIILDVLMPDVNGKEIVRHIRQRMQDYETPVIVVSALSDRGSRVELLLEGANDYITKPCDPQEVYKALEQCTTSQLIPFLDSFIE